MQADTPEPTKDEDAAHPIASVWRPILSQIVSAFSNGDYGLERGIPSVKPVPAELAEQIATYIAGYGETLVDLPAETWSSSVSQWMGSHWDVLVDLWTAESGRSDMVLFGRVFEEETGFSVEIDSVHVP